mmetsp:Transcript_57795/g.135444  ORF Transcript_57795/g.135444 Transcript_57795/m.135444 type:complete len:218 (+) Transcript_57795:809-1462(+)
MSFATAADEVPRCAEAAWQTSLPARPFLPLALPRRLVFAPPLQLRALPARVSAAPPPGVAALPPAPGGCALPPDASAPPPPPSCAALPPPSLVALSPSSAVPVPPALPSASPAFAARPPPRAHPRSPPRRPRQQPPGWRPGTSRRGGSACAVPASSCSRHAHAPGTCAPQTGRGCICLGSSRRRSGTRRRAKHAGSSSLSFRASPSACLLLSHRPPA